MSQSPFGKLKNTGVDFTPTIHNDTYSYIAPTSATNHGKTVLITGASKGLGRATAISYARAGASGIVLAARGDLSAVEQAVVTAAAEAGRPKPTVFSVMLDVTDRTSVDEAAEAVSKKFEGKIDVLINNAGYLETFDKVGRTDPEDWWRTWEVNVKGVYLVTRAFLPLLLKGKDKTIISLSSFTAHFLPPGSSAYSTSKLALLRFTEFIMDEYGPEGVLAYCIHPGAVVTELASNMPQEMHGLLVDKVDLAADTLAWLTRERRGWLAGRYLSATWDMEELEKKKDDIVRGDLLKVRLAVELGQ